MTVHSLLVANPTFFFAFHKQLSPQISQLFYLSLVRHIHLFTNYLRALYI